MDGLPHERLQVSGRVPEVRGDTPSNNPQLPSCVHLVPCGHFGCKLCLLSLPFLSVAVVAGGGYPTRVVLHELAKDDVEISYLVSTGSRYLAGGRSGCRYLGILSSRRAWTGANSASTCWAHVAKSSEGKAAPHAGAPEEDHEPARAAAARARRVASASALAEARAAAPGESHIIEETARSARHSSSHSELSQRQSPQVSQQQSQRISLTAEMSQPISHFEPVWLTMLLSSLRASLASQQPDRLVQGPLCYTRTSTSNHPRVDLIGQRAITPNFFLPYILNPYLLVLR